MPSTGAGSGEEVRYCDWKARILLPSGTEDLCHWGRRANSVVLKVHLKTHGSCENEREKTLYPREGQKNVLDSKFRESLTL